MNLRTQYLKHYVRDVFGNDQNDLFRFSLKSLIERIEFATYHLEEMRRLLHPFTSTGGPQPGRDDAFMTSIAQAAAHVTACAQSLHACADICGHTVYFGLGLNLTSPPLDEYKIGAKSVSKMLPDQSEVPDHLCLLLEDGEFPYLDA